jgi:hypothetical protein
VLATASSSFGNLQTFRLLLELATRDPGLIPEPLAEQVKLIIRQALEVDANPQSIGPDTRPEAIALVYAMRSNRQLETDIQKLMELQVIDKAIAGATLRHLDAAFVA